MITFLLGRVKIGKKSTLFLRISMLMYCVVYGIFVSTNVIPRDIVQSLLIVYQLGIVIGVFFAGIGIGYADLQSSTPTTLMMMNSQLDRLNDL